MTPRAFSTVVCHWTLLSFREYMHSLLIAFLVPFLCLALVVIFLVIFHGCLSLHLEFYWVFFYGKLFVNKKMEFFQFYFLKFRRFDDFCGEILEYKPRRGLFYQSRLKTALKSVKFYQFFPVHHWQRMLWNFLMDQVKFILNSANQNRKLFSFLNRFRSQLKTSTKAPSDAIGPSWYEFFSWLVLHSLRLCMCVHEERNVEWHCGVFTPLCGWK